MKNLITSTSGKKEAQILRTAWNGFRATLFLVVNTGIGIEKDYWQSKQNFSTYEKAAKWAIKQMN